MDAEEGRRSAFRPTPTPPPPPGKYSADVVYKQLRDNTKSSDFQACILGLYCATYVVLLLARYCYRKTSVHLSLGSSLYEDPTSAI